MATYQLAALTCVMIANATVDSLGPHNLLPTITARTAIGRKPSHADVAPLLQYNFLNENLPQYDDLPRRLMRSAVIGFSASAISDTCSNSVRVVKTSKQTATTPITYPEVVKVC